MTTADTPWLRLSARKLLIDPVKVLGQFVVPTFLGLVGIHQAGGATPWWAVPFVFVGAVIIGALPWLTTFYRITDSQFEVRTGLLNKTTKTAPLDRVRSVDLEATLLYRIVGLSKVQIGTGDGFVRITLDSVSREQAHNLRAFLLKGKNEPVGRPTPASDIPWAIGPDHSAEQTPARPAPPAPAIASDAQVLAAIRWTWVRFAPFSLAWLVAIAAILGALAPLGNQLLDVLTTTPAWSHLVHLGLSLVIGGLIVGGLVGWVMVAVTGYVIRWWGMRLTREGGSLHLSAGLFTTRSISVEEKRIRGVEMKERVLLRLVGGAELSTLATGVGLGGVTAVLPPCPRGVVRSVGADVLQSPTAMTVALTLHGAAAHRRSWIRHLRLAVFLVACLTVATFALDLPSWLLVAVGLATIARAALVGEAAYRHLGHATTGEHLVVGSGELTRVRTVLEHDGIIGWVVRQSWFQRRAHLATLVATTAAGSGKVVARDIPLGAAIRLADESTPGVLTAFLA